jgi:hypothetical protein
MIHRLVHALQMLAAPVEEHSSQGAGSVDPMERLAGDYADALMLVTDCPQLRLSAEQHAALERVDDELAVVRARVAKAHSGVAGRQVVEWQRVRRHARAALMALDQPTDD